MSGVPSGDYGNWDYVSLRDQSHTCLGKIKFRAFPKRVGKSASKHLAKSPGANGLITGD